VQWSAVAHAARGRVVECDRAIEWAAEIAQRLASPRFAWEVDLNRGMRLMDRGDREGGEALVRRAGSVVGRLRPDIHAAVEVIGLLVAEWIFDGESAISRVVYEAWERVIPRGLVSALIGFAAAFDGDLETGRRRLRSLLADDLKPLRGPDAYLPTALWALALTATVVEDREAGARLRPLLEPMRPYNITPLPAVGFGQLAEWPIGRLELLADRPDKAVADLRAAVARADADGIVWASALIRGDLAKALHRVGDAEEAAAILAEAEATGAQYGVGWANRNAAEARAEIEGRAHSARTPAGRHSRAVRAFAARGGRRALAALVEGRSDAELERRFADPRRQRSLLRGLARSFQPSQASGFRGTIAFELEPFAIEPAANAPWRWAIEVDSGAGRAKLLDTAPLEAAATIHIGLAEWVRVVAGIENPLAAMVAGRCSVEGDAILAMRLEAMFGASRPSSAAFT
jgi:hypothetical protein